METILALMLAAVLIAGLGAVRTPKDVRDKVARKTEALTHLAQGLDDAR